MKIGNTIIFYTKNSNPLIKLTIKIQFLKFSKFWKFFNFFTSMLLTLNRPKLLLQMFPDPPEVVIWNSISLSRSWTSDIKNDQGLICEKSIWIQNFDKIFGSMFLQNHHRGRIILLSEKVETAFLLHCLYKPFWRLKRFLYSNLELIWLTTKFHQISTFSSNF